MTKTRTRKPAPKKRRTTRKKKGGSRFPAIPSLSRIIIFLVLILFLFLSIGAAGYVIFFRVVVAAELDHGRALSQAADVLQAGVKGSDPGTGESELSAHGESR